MAPTPAALSQPEEEKPVDGGVDPRHSDLRLQTRLSSERLQTRLLDIYYDGQTYEQEQGISILYLAIGFLKWYESPVFGQGPIRALVVAPGRSGAPLGEEPVPDPPRGRHHDQPVVAGEAQGGVRGRPARGPRPR